jgi:hypothetical protein
MLKRVSQMSLVVALNAVQLAKHKTEVITIIVVAIKNAKCTMSSAQTVEKKLRFLSNHVVTSPYIAVIASEFRPWSSW